MGIPTNTKEKIVICAERLIQLNGYNAFSYKHIAEEIGIKTSSIHYHFESKEVLVQEVVEYYSSKLFTLVEQLDTNSALESEDKLLQVLNSIFSLTFHDDGKMCLVGMLSSDIRTLPDSIKDRVRVFFDQLSAWIETQLLHSDKIDDKEAAFQAQLILTQLEGGLLFARLYSDSLYVKNLTQYIKSLFN